MYTAFVVSSIVEDNPIGDKIDAHNVQLLEQLLNATVQLAAYGTGVAGIAGVFLGTVPEDVVHEEEISFDPSTREAYLQLRLPYAALEPATEQEVLGLMAQRYLQGLRDLARVAQAADFDWARLVRDVQGLFVDEGLGNDEFFE